MADWRDGYESTRPEDADAPNRPSGQPYLKPDGMAEAYKERWKNVPVAYPFGKAKDGGSGGGK